MSEAPRLSTMTLPASHVLGGKLDSIPFSSFHLGVILVLGFVALVDGYDGSMTGTLLVLAKKPLDITPGQIRLRPFSLELRTPDGKDDRPLASALFGGESVD